MRADAKQNYERLLTVARALVAEEGVDVSMREIARRAEVGFGTMHRHFPTREVLLEALLRTGFDAMADRADELEKTCAPDEALRTWLREMVAAAHSYSGVTATMMAAIEDPASALHASCVTMKAAGTRLLTRAQAAGLARSDVDGADLFALVASLAWLADQPSQGSHAERLLGIMTEAIVKPR